MYEKFYGLSEKPFHIVPNPNFLYLSSKHQHALTYLEYGIREGMGFILLTGEIGTGKTTLIRHILNEIESEMEVAVVFNTNVNANQLLGLILHEFDLEADDHDKAKNLDKIHHFLIEKYGKRQRVLVIIDEAQNLAVEVLEEVRMLSNLQADDTFLLQIMLVGQPELKTKLNRPGLAQLTQRIAVNYHLMPLSREETGVYIESRLEKVGGTPDLFTEEAIDVIYRVSNGTPRSINMLCDTALVYGFADEVRHITREVVDQVLADKGDMVIGADSASPTEDIAVIRDATGDVGLFQQRLANLEGLVQELRMQMQWQLEALEKSSQGVKDELVEQLIAHLDQERKKNEKLLLEFGRAKERIKSLEERNTLLNSGGTTPVQGSMHGRAKKAKKYWFSFR